MTYNWDVDLALGNAAEVGDDLADDRGDVQAVRNTVTRELIILARPRESFVGKCTHDWDIDLALGNTTKVADDVVDNGSHVQVVKNRVLRSLEFR